VTMGEGASQSVRSYLMWWGTRSEEGEASSMVMGKWCKPVKGREDSHPLTKGRRRGFANAKSITEERAFPERGNLVYTPGEFRRAKPPSPANLKYAAQEESSCDEKEGSGAANRL